MSFNVAIDGPAGAGKSTIAKRIAADFGYMYIDTGAMYRSLAYNAIKLGIDIENQKDKVIEMLDCVTLDVKYNEEGQHMILCGEDITAYIRTPKVSAGASAIVVAVYSSIIKSIAQTMSMFNGVNFIGISYAAQIIIISFVLLGIGIGTIGSIFSIRKYLQV